jgi:hypothetical protein
MILQHHEILAEKVNFAKLNADVTRDNRRGKSTNNITTNFFDVNSGREGVPRKCRISRPR